ncbi:MAG: hypothetical protein KBG48_14570 [Kofleriaceae bacterium]|jgi:hypothetical protein|nr:hypothetical protein [Kofleriaceae bacterium]MBP9168616.1 hypothetical protein [Kofleriaceae bacterium]MBP9857510.1 hypothetical protein [Kofleriaceae bacterium]
MATRVDPPGSRHWLGAQPLAREIPVANLELVGFGDYDVVIAADRDGVVVTANDDRGVVSRVACERSELIDLSSVLACLPARR